MPIFKQDKQYKFKSEPLVIFKTKKLKVDMELYYDRYLQINVWVKEKEGNLFILRHWPKIPLTRYYSYVCKIAKYDNKIDKLKRKMTIIELNRKRKEIERMQNN